MTRGVTSGICWLLIPHDSMPGTFIDLQVQVDLFFGACMLLSIFAYNVSEGKRWPEVDARRSER